MACIKLLTMWLLLAMLALQSASATRDDPPRELFSELPPPTYIPRLLSAEHNELHFNINIGCRCLNMVWEYKMEEERNWTRHASFCPRYEQFDRNNVATSCDKPVSLRNLNASSTYLVKTMLVYSDLIEPYLNKLLPFPPYTATVHVVTCPANVAAIEDLQVHSAGSRWVVVSWLPPPSLCHTRLRYEVKIAPVLLYDTYNDTFVQKGIFWSDSPWTVEKPIMSCISWPDRHCLLIQWDSRWRRLESNQEYQIEVRVNRFYSRKNSTIITIKANTTTLYIPSPPTELHCQWTLSEGLEVRWRAPLRPGGVLTTAHVRITHGHNHPLYERHMNISSVVNYTYVHHVNVTLEEDQQYDVFVYFGTSSNKYGEEAHVVVWRPSSKSNVTSLTIVSPTKRKDTETMDEKNVTEAMDEKNGTEAEKITETMDEKNGTEAMDKKNVIETMDEKNVTEAINGKNVTETITIMNRDNMTDVVVKETVVAYGGGNVLWGVVFMLFMGLLVVGVFLAIRRWGSRWACLSRDADQLATPTNTPIMTSIQESRV
ncbi:hypothetical protein R5R35_014614 [Gryllus longicercus]|uniref:Uncharacterized protein n=1 Tax=Gryllus longicercus TaxID=2509291 RepID=A0AAN9V4T3_9ORTH